MATKKSEKKGEIVQDTSVDLKKKITTMTKAVDTITLTNDDDMAKAGELQVNVKKFQKYILQEKKKQLDPANETVKAIKAYWAPFEDKVAQALNSLSRSMIAYHDVQEQIRKKEEDRIARAAEAGRMKEETAVNKLDELGDEKKTMHTGEGSVTFTKIRKVRFSDLQDIKKYNGNGAEQNMLELVRAGYLVWDEVKARKDALAGQTIWGVEIYEETSTNTRA